MAMYIDKENHFIDFFNPKTGLYIRSNVYDKAGNETKEDPFMRNFPSLIDVGVMGNCKSKSICTVGCYQGDKQFPNMKLSDFKGIVDQCKGKSWEFAMGGNGNPNHHEDFAEMVRYAKENDIVPNYTTSGLELEQWQIEATRDYCGAVAVSYYAQDFTFDAIKRFIEAGCKTNIHYVLGNDSIDKALYLLENDLFPKGINAVIFLMYKPVGCVKENNVLQYEDPRVKEFFSLIDSAEDTLSHKVGLDACTIPALFNFTTKISKTHTTPCDGGSFSMYITHDMIALPCSFDNQHRKYAHDLKGSTIQDAWKSESFDRFRNYHKHSCKECPDQNNCRAGCPIAPEINLCQRKEKNYCENKD